MALLVLRPAGAGDETNISSQDPGTGYHWDKVDDVTADGDDTMPYTSAAEYQRDLYAFENQSINAGVIKSVTIYARCRAGDNPTQASLKIAIKSGGTTTEDSVKTLTNSWADYSKTWTTNPATGNKFTWTEIDALQAGVSLREAIPDSNAWSGCTQLWMVVDYYKMNILESSINELYDYLSANIAAKLDALDAEYNDGVTLDDIKTWYKGNVPLEIPEYPSLCLQGAKLNFEERTKDKLYLKNYINIFIFVTDDDDYTRFQRLCRYARAVKELLLSGEATYGYSYTSEGPITISDTVGAPTFLQGTVIPISLYPLDGESY